MNSQENDNMVLKNKTDTYNKLQEKKIYFVEIKRKQQVIYS